MNNSTMRQEMYGENTGGISDAQLKVLNNLSDC